MEQKQGMGGLPRDSGCKRVCGKVNTGSEEGYKQMFKWIRYF